jgi:hypothetical protein
VRGLLEALFSRQFDVARVSEVDALAEAGVGEVVLIGGEAYLRNDFILIIRRVRERGMSCTMTTGGYNLTPERATAMVEAGILDPTKVTRTALQNAASVASLMLTTEAMVAELPKDDEEGAGMPGVASSGATSGWSWPQAGPPWGNISRLARNFPGWPCCLVALPCTAPLIAG